MKEININNFKEKLFYEKLDNGFEVFLVPIRTKKNFFTTIGVKFGGRDVNFKIDDIEYNVPTGIAHFLEHKMFEKKVNPFSFYQKTGTDVNASTSYDFTRYYIFGNKSYNKNLTYLLRWLKDLDLTEDQIEKEKEIIIEEANMYKDKPDIVAIEAINKNIFVNDPYKNKIIGTDEDIRKVTKQEVELCYQNFYTADNMFLISVGNFNPKKAIEIIKEEVKYYPLRSKKVEKLYEKEPEQVLKKEEIIKMNVDIPRINAAYKIKKDIFKDINLIAYELDLYLHILIDISLGTTSDIRNKWLMDKLFVNARYQIIENEDYYIIEFIALSNKPDELQEQLDQYLKNLITDKSSFERQKKIWIAGEVKNINNIQNICLSILDDILDYEQYINNKIEIIKKLNYDTLIKIKDKLNFNIKTSVKIINN